MNFTHRVEYSDNAKRVIVVFALEENEQRWIAGDGQSIAISAPLHSTTNQFERAPGENGKRKKRSDESAANQQSTTEMTKGESRKSEGQWLRNESTTHCDGHTHTKATMTSK